MIYYFLYLPKIS